MKDDKDKDAIAVSIVIITGRVLRTVIVGSRLVIFIISFHRNAFLCMQLYIFLKIFQANEWVEWIGQCFILSGGLTSVVNGFLAIFTLKIALYVMGAFYL